MSTFYCILVLDCVDTIPITINGEGNVMVTIENYGMEEKEAIKAVEQLSR